MAPFIKLPTLPTIVFINLLLLLSDYSHFKLLNVIPSVHNLLSCLSVCTCTYAVNMTNPYAKIARQSEGTWALFHKRVSSIQFDYSDLFTDKVYSFLENMAKFIGSSIGYLLPSILTSTAFALGSHGAQLMVGTHLQPINIFTIFIGHPGTGKSPAIEKIINLLRENTEIGKEILISRSTSSGLVKLLAKHGKAFVHQKSMTF